MAADGARVLMLGTPNDGSWAPMQVLSGDDTFGNLLIGGRRAVSRHDATRQLIAGFPGLIQLQAGLLNGLGDAGSVARARQRPTSRRCRRASCGIACRCSSRSSNGEFRLRPCSTTRWSCGGRSTRQRDRDLAVLRPQASARRGQGRAPRRPATSSSDAGVVYLNAPNGGDGRVLLESALLPGVATWAVDADHGSLPRRREAFAAYRDLLTTGTTSRLPSLPPLRQRAARPRRRQAARAQPPVATIAGRQRRRSARSTCWRPRRRRPPCRTQPPTAALRITVINGDLTYIAEPLLIGHYRVVEA